MAKAPLAKSPAEHTATPVCLPCPFCGSSNVDPEGWSTLPQYAKTPEERSGPACDDCEATAPSINMWNSRHNNSHADLVKALEAAKDWMMVDLDHGDEAQFEVDLALVDAALATASRSTAEGN